MERLRTRVLSDAAVSALLPSALDLPAEEGVRLIALHWLRELERLRADWAQRLVANESPRAADDAGVERALDDALTRVDCLYSTLRENRVLLGSNRRVRRALRRLGRDLDHHRRPFALRSRLASHATGAGTPGVRGAMVALDGRASATATLGDLAGLLAHRLDDALAGLDDSLSRYTEHRTVGQAPLRRSLAAHLASRIGESAAAMDAAIADARWKRVRRNAGAQRAMLAPFARGQRDIGAWLHRAIATASALRTHHDIIRASRLVTDTSEARAALDAEALGVLDAWRAGWRPGAISAARDAIAALDATAAVNALPMEIERKFLLRAAPPEIASVSPLAIEQGWLPGVVLRERLRRSTDADGNVTLTRTVKAGALSARVELEEETTTELFDALWPHTRQARIRKLRHRVREGEFTWEIDVFADRDLVLAEVELTNNSDMPPIPEWLAVYVLRDVTEDPAYANSVMATPDPALDASPDASFTA